MASIKTFTSKGTTVSYQSKAPTAHLGTFDPVTGRIYQKPRLKLDDLSGSNVVVTNPAALPAQRVRRTASLGMGNVGQRGRNFDIPGLNE